ncbi:MAG: hypothetical protein ACSHYB_04230 [Roseibacillus sp.]
MSCLIAAIGGMTVFAGISLWIRLQVNSAKASGQHEWLLAVGMILGGVSAMFAGNIAVQVGHWIAGKEVWSHSRNPVRAACRKAVFELATVFGFAGSIAGFLWLSMLVLYRDFSMLWFALGTFVLSLFLLASVAWWSRRKGRSSTPLGE